MEVKRHTGSILGSLKHLAIRFDLIPGVYLNFAHSLGFEIAVRLPNDDNFVMVLVCIINEFEDVWQKSRVCDDGLRPVHLKNPREQLGGAQGNGGNGLFREREVTDEEFYNACQFELFSIRVRPNGTYQCNH